MLRAAVALSLLALAPACSESPADGFEAFYQGLAEGSPDALARLSSRAAADFSASARAKGLAPAELLVSSVPKSTVRSIDVVERDGTTAVLEVKDALGKTARVRMVLEDGRWKVDVTP